MPEVRNENGDITHSAIPADRTELTKEAIEQYQAHNPDFEAPSYIYNNDFELRGILSENDQNPFYYSPVANNLAELEKYYSEIEVWGEVKQHILNDAADTSIKGDLGGEKLLQTLNDISTADTSKAGEKLVEVWKHARTTAQEDTNIDPALVTKGEVENDIVEALEVFTPAEPLPWGWIMFGLLGTVVVAGFLIFLISHLCERNNRRCRERRQRIDERNTVTRRRRLATPFADLVDKLDLSSPPPILETHRALAQEPDFVERILSMNGIEYVLGASCITQVLWCALGYYLYKGCTAPRKAASNDNHRAVPAN